MTFLMEEVQLSVLVVPDQSRDLLGTPASVWERVSRIDPRLEIGNLPDGKGVLTRRLKWAR